MKRILNLAAITALLVFSASFQNAASAQDDEYYNNDESYENYENDGGGEVSYQTFYDELSPHGRWIDNPEYGYVWVPNAGRDFRPYSTNGHWVYTNNYEWMWVSDYSWGWAPFHYGRWTLDPYYGWVWVPGYEWSPAWVAWRSGGDYYGWAPIRPGISISINIGFGNYSPPYDYWSFVPRRYITSPRIYDYYYDRSRIVTIYNHTTIINNYNYRNNIWRTGPTRMEVERYAGRITPVRFRESSRPGRTQFRNNEVAIYRPRVQRDNTRRFAPRAVERYDRQGRTNEIADNTIRNGRNNERTDRTFDTRNGGNVRGNGNVRRERTNEAPVIRQNDNNLPSQQQRQFERRNSDRTSNAPQREQRREMRTMERPQQAPQQQQRSFEPRGNGNGQAGQQRREVRTMERPQQAPQQQQRSFEPRGNGNGQAGQQRREVRTMESPQQAPQQQRQFERRSETGNNETRSQGNGGGNGNGRGRGRS